MPSELLAPEKENTIYLAESITKLSSYLSKEERLYFNLALDYVELYKSTFGDEGYVFLDNKVDSLMTKYGFDKPDANGLQEIKNLTEKLYTLKMHQSRHYQDQKNFNSFVESENNEISMSSENAALGAFKNINSKEKIMSDEFEDFGEEVKEEVKELSPKQQAYVKAAMEARYERKVIADAINNGTLACLPGADGYADTAPARNIMNPNDNYHGVTMLFLKEHQKQNGFPTAEYITKNQIDKAHEDNSSLFVMKGQHGVSIHINEKNEDGEWEDKYIKLFNVAQVSKPAVIKKWAEEKLEEKELRIRFHSMVQNISLLKKNQESRA